MKPLGIKNYGSIGHIIGSRMGSGDHHCPPGQSAIVTTKVRDKHDLVICTEKLDGSNVGVAKINGAIVPLVRSGYTATSSPYKHHHRFAEWVYANQSKFDALLDEGERVVGEWLLMAHGTRYKLPHDPFVAFDLMVGTTRKLYRDFLPKANQCGIVTASVLHHANAPFALIEALATIEVSGHGALDPVEGVVWRVERLGKVEFLCKYVRPEKVDGCYLPEISGGEPVWNRYVGCDTNIFDWLYQ